MRERTEAWHRAGLPVAVRPLPAPVTFGVAGAPLRQPGAPWRQRCTVADATPTHSPPTPGP